MNEDRTLQAANNRTIGEFVAEDYRTARVFERYGIDFCCGSKIALSAVCREKGSIQPRCRRRLRR